MDDILARIVERSASGLRLPRLRDLRLRWEIGGYREVLLKLRGCPGAELGQCHSRDQTAVAVKRNYSG
jgi:hypothetical protein